MPSITEPPAGTARWRGFNLLELFSTSVRWGEQFPIRFTDGIQESDFAIIADLGFDFVRVPMSYLWFGTGAFSSQIDESRFGLIDRVVKLGLQYGIHVSLNFHHAPGYCVTSSSYFDTPEPGDLFTDAALQDLFVAYWHALSIRYHDVPDAALSFNLLNEPPQMDEDVFDTVFGQAAEAIWEISPDRTIIMEGWDWGLVPPPRHWWTHPKVITSVHLYRPFEITHFECPWFDQSENPPSWPIRSAMSRALAQGYVPLEGQTEALWDDDALERLLQPWLEVINAGGRVHVGEFGAYTRTPHAVYLKWLEAQLSLLKRHGIGWAMWNFRGPFGVADSNRDDVHYENYRELRLDRRLLEVLQRN